MSLLISAFNLILYQPLFNLLVLLYAYLPGHDFGIAVIVLTVIIRLVLYPLMAQSIKSQKILSELQPKLQEVQRRYKTDREKQAKEIIELYKKEKINPLGGFLPLLIQLPILIALYQVFWKGFLPESMTKLYSFVFNPGLIDPTFLGIINLAQGSFVLALLAGFCQFFQTKMVAPRKRDKEEKGSNVPDFSKMMQKQMLYFFPAFTVFFLWKLPAAIGLYWIVTSLFSIGQQYLIFKNSNKTALLGETPSA